MFKFEDFQKFGQDGSENVQKAFAASQKSAQAIFAEVQDYSKKSVEAGQAHFEKLLGVKALDKAIELQTSFAKSSYEGFVAHATKLGELYTNAAKEAAKPFEAAVAKAQAK
ncbi:MAG: phasin family protein [Proteobacteria bacterium]|nr:phasin family protein [Pseudomonadota bacterium]